MDDTENLALIKGDVATADPVLVSMHAENIVEDLLGVGRDEGRRSLVERAMRKIGKEGRGVIVIIREVREGVIRARLSEASSSSDGEPSEKRLIDYGIGAQILLDLGIKNMVLLSNSPTPKIVGLEGYGLNLIARLPIDDQ